ncbi:DUF4215 domain-containing protein [Plesiocystis pacifica]|uniref:DUF4215 domain-containing protein n=1 Tax=Plesiocystis pacifica TaxID=191768 RepID=UPI000A311B70|nr:DUF4215 domain-containing protein [Plesiocystis pacifica]
MLAVQPPRAHAPLVLALVIGLGAGLGAGCRGEGLGDEADTTELVAAETGEAEAESGPVCGDGVVEGSESCDLGAENSDQGACTSTCATATCGDGFVQLGVEACDDGNTVDDDGCQSDCSLGTCGDGIVGLGEECDGGVFDTPECDDDCTLPVCGDAHVNAAAGEECDDGDDKDNDYCPGTCKLATCGDGFVWYDHEDCDDANGIDDDVCQNDCDYNYHPLCEGEDYPDLHEWDRAYWDDGLDDELCDQAGVANQSPDWVGPGWYDFDEWDRLATSPSYSGCGGEKGGWLDGYHPSPPDGVVTRTICFGLEDGVNDPDPAVECETSVEVEIVACKHRYLVNLPDAPACNLRYCTNPSDGQ